MNTTTKLPPGWKICDATWIQNVHYILTIISLHCVHQFLFMWLMKLMTKCEHFPAKWLKRPISLMNIWHRVSCINFLINDLNGRTRKKRATHTNTNKNHNYAIELTINAIIYSALWFNRLEKQTTLHIFK